MDMLAERLSAHLESLRGEVRRLEQLLMLDADWRALQECEADGRKGEAGAPIRAELLGRLDGNRLYRARAKLIESIALLTTEASSGTGSSLQQPLASRIVLLGEVTSGPFRTRVRRKEAAPAPPQVETPQPVAVGERDEAKQELEQAASPPPNQDAPRPSPDALELIDGLSRPAVEMLMDGGVTCFDDIARWTSVDVRHWRERLDGMSTGEPGRWIEQAAILATGARTFYALRARRGDFAALVAMPEPLPERGEIARGAPSCQYVMPAAGADATDASRLLSADDLVGELAAAAAAGGRGSEADASAVGRAPLVPVNIARRVYSRPTPPAVERCDGDVVVIPRGGPADQAGGAPAASQRPRPQKLLRRLKQVIEADRFEAENYSAYRAVVEEASVTIVRPGDHAPRRAVQRPREETSPAYGKFLKALTGD